VARPKSKPTDIVKAHQQLFNQFKQLTRASHEFGDRWNQMSNGFKTGTAARDYPRWLARVTGHVEKAAGELDRPLDNLHNNWMVEWDEGWFPRRKRWER
jgi:hypothetical protein